MRLLLVTPCLNAADKIERTMLSVLTQTVLKNPDFKLSYIIMDGGSDDGTMELANKTASLFVQSENITVSVYSEKDAGMYDALSQGFLREQGQNDIYAYINAGDFYSEYAFEVVSELMFKEDVHFLTGLICGYNERSHLDSVTMPYSYDRDLLQKGFYGKMLPYVQQESIFWSKELHIKIDHEKFKSFKYAGDYYLWNLFSKYKSLNVVHAWLGGFATHDGQLTQNHMDAYFSEFNAIRTKANPYDYIKAIWHGLLWCLPTKIKRKMAKTVFVYDSQRRQYCRAGAKET